MSDNPRHKKSGRLPVSAHPAFPVIVALWFSAALSFTSMVLPIALLERVTLAGGLPGIVAAAEPPLGTTARFAIALTAGALGAVFGFAIARMVTQRSLSARRPAQADAPSEQAEAAIKRPISAHEELGEGGFDASELNGDGGAAMPAGRRALALEDDTPRDALSFAPFPGQSENEWDEPLDLIAFEASDAQSGDAEPAPALVAETPVIAAPPGDPAAVPLAERPLADLGMVELVERFALALDRHRAAATVPDTVPAPTPAMPEALRPLDLGEPDDTDEDEEEGGAAYTSLLSMKGTAGHAREPVVAFPGQPGRRAAPSESAVPPSLPRGVRHSGETERALREALEKLQKMSGAA